MLRNYEWMSVATSFEMKWVFQLHEILVKHSLLQKWYVDFDVKLLCSLALCPIWVFFSTNSMLLMLKSNFRWILRSKYLKFYNFCHLILINYFVFILCYAFHIVVDFITYSWVQCCDWHFLGVLVTYQEQDV
jgi:hypothetical protein